MPDRPDDLAPDRTVRTARSAHPARFGRPPRARRVALSVAAVGGLLLAACGGPPTSGDQEAGGRTTVVEGEGGGGLPECPLEALEEATAPVKLDLWYGGLGGSTQ